MELVSNGIFRGVVIVVVVDLENHCPSSKWKMRRFQNFNTILLFIPVWNLLKWELKLVHLPNGTDAAAVVFTTSTNVAASAWQATLLHLFCSIWWLFWCLCISFCYMSPEWSTITGAYHIFVRAMYKMWASPFGAH